ncbi:hypothetical protein F5Y14DRAFT_416815 [Nemania sp. NC0429]|nr:hypothetical protein F5Y14DRAFT_416815 [Nemania sp. NC0429]
MSSLDDTPFILSTSGNNQPEDPHTRKLIRRHVMLGKNRGKRFPLRRKSARKGTPTTKASSQDTCLLANRNDSFFKIPRQIGSDLSSMAWADSVDVSTMATIMDFTRFTKKSMHRVEKYIDFPPKGIEWMEPFIQDAAWVHMMAFSSYAVINVVRGDSTQLVDQRASRHFTRSMRLLRERLLEDDKTLSTTNSTVQIVLGLATHANMHGDFEEARCHLTGLHRMVELRGGIGSFRPWPKLILEILRTDISLSIHCGITPLFFQSLSTDVQWPYSLDRFPHKRENEYALSSHCPDLFPNVLDHELDRAWRILVDFSFRINNAVLTNSHLPRDILVDTVASVMYGLLRMRFAPGSLDELTRLGLLAFGTNVFLQWQQSFPVGPACFPSMLRESLSQFRQADECPHFMVWVLLIGASTVFGADDNTWLHPWLRSITTACGVHSWDDVSAILHRAPWVDVLHHGDLGRGIFAEAYNADYSGGRLA